MRLYSPCTQLSDSVDGLWFAGIGSHDGCSVVVQYQAEINHLQTMLNRTKGRVDEIQKYVHKCNLFHKKIGASCHWARYERG